MSKRVEYMTSEAYQLGYKDGCEDTIAEACEWLKYHSMVDWELFRKAMEE